MPTSSQWLAFLVASILITLGIALAIEDVTVQVPVAIAANVCDLNVVALGERELELHPADGHTSDGTAVWIPWARVLVAGDYLSPVEIPRP